MRTSFLDSGALFDLVVVLPIVFGFVIYVVRKQRRNHVR